MANGPDDTNRDDDSLLNDVDWDSVIVDDPDSVDNRSIKQKVVDKLKGDKLVPTATIDLARLEARTTEVRDSIRSRILEVDKDLVVASKRVYESSWLHEKWMTSDRREAVVAAVRSLYFKGESYIKGDLVGLDDEDYKSSKWDVDDDGEVVDVVEKPKDVVEEPTKELPLESDVSEDVGDMVGTHDETEEPTEEFEPKTMELGATETGKIRKELVYAREDPGSVPEPPRVPEGPVVGVDEAKIKELIDQRVSRIPERVITMIRESLRSDQVINSAKIFIFLIDILKDIPGAIDGAVDALEKRLVIKMGADKAELRELIDKIIEEKGGGEVVGRTVEVISDYDRLTDKILGQIRVQPTEGKTILYLGNNAVKIPHGKDGKGFTVDEARAALKGMLSFKDSEDGLKSLIEFDGKVVAELSHGRDADYDQAEIVEEVLGKVRDRTVEVDYGEIVRRMRGVVSEMVDRDGLVQSVLVEARKEGLVFNEDKVKEVVAKILEQNKTVDQAVNSDMAKNLEELTRLKALLETEIGQARSFAEEAQRSELEAEKLATSVAVATEAASAFAKRAESSAADAGSSAGKAENEAKNAAAAAEIAKQVEETVSEFQQKLDGGVFNKQTIDELKKLNPNLDTAKLQQLVSDYASDEVQILKNGMKGDIEAEVEVQLAAKLAAQPQLPTPDQLEQMISGIVKGVITGLLKKLLSSLAKFIIKKIKENQPASADPVDVNDLANKVAAILAAQPVVPPAPVDVDDLANKVAAILAAQPAAAQSSTQAGSSKPPPLPSDAERAKRLQQSRAAAASSAPGTQPSPLQTVLRSSSSAVPPVSQVASAVSAPASAPDVNQQRRDLEEMKTPELTSAEIARLNEILKYKLPLVEGTNNRLDLKGRDDLRVAFAKLLDSFPGVPFGEVLDAAFPVKSPREISDLEDEVDSMGESIKSLKSTAKFLKRSDLKTELAHLFKGVSFATESNLKLWEEQMKEAVKNGEGDKAKVLSDDIRKARSNINKVKLFRERLEILVKHFMVLVKTDERNDLIGEDFKVAIKSIHTKILRGEEATFEEAYNNLIPLLESDEFSGLVDKVFNKRSALESLLTLKQRELNQVKEGVKLSRDLKDVSFAKKVFEYSISKKNIEDDVEMELSEVSRIASREFLNETWEARMGDSLTEVVDRANDDLLKVMGEVAFKEKFLAFEYQAAGRTYKPFEGLQPSDFDTPELIDRLFAGGRLGLKDGFFALVAMEKFMGKGTKQYNAIRENVLKLLVDKEGLTQSQAVKAFNDKNDKERLFQDIFDKFDEARKTQEKHKNEKIRTKVKIANRKVRLGQIKKRRYMEALEDAGVAEDGVINSALVSDLRLKVNYAAHSRFINKVGTKALNAPLWAIEEGLAKPVVGLGGWAAAQPLNAVDWAAGATVRWGARYPLSLLRAPGYVLTHPFGIFRPFKTLKAAGGSVGEGWKKIEQGKASGKERRVGRAAGWKKSARELVSLKTDMNKWGEGEDSDNSVAALEDTVRRLDKKIDDEKVSLGVDVDLNFNKYKEDVKKAA